MEQPGLVGRGSESQALGEWLDAAQHGRGRLVLVAGEPGIGKTALVSAFADSAALRAPVAWGHSMEQVSATPLRPWRQVAAALGGADRLDIDRSRDPVGERFARFDAFTGWLVEAANRNGGAVVVLEDIHAADEATLHLLATVAGATAGSSLLLVATYRDVDRDQVPGFPLVLDTLGRLRNVERLRLRGLDRSAVADLIGENGNVVDRVVAATNGNPLFVTELAQHVAEGGTVDTIPRSVRDAVLVRLQRLTPECAETLRTAAVTGRRFDAGVVATALDEPAVSVLERVHEAVAAGFVEVADAPGRYQFVHALVRDAVEATIAPARLPAVHRQVAEAIEGYEGASEDNLSDLARHWDIAAVLGDRAAAATRCERAARAADRRLAWEEAAHLYERAADLGAASLSAAHRSQLLLDAARNRLHSDDVTSAVERCVTAADLARDAGRPDLVADAALVVEGRGGPTVDIVGRLTENALAAIAESDPTRRARLLGQLATVAFYRDPERLAELSAASLEAAAATDDPLAIVAVTRARQMMCANPEGAVERLDLASRIGDAGRRLGRPTITQWEHIWRIDALAELGRLPEAVAELQRLRSAVAQAPVPVAQWHLARIETLVAQMAGRYADAEAWAVTARDLFAAHENADAARMMWFGVRRMIAEHTGYDEDLLEFDTDVAMPAPPFLGDLPILGEAQHRLAKHDVEGAAALYDRLAPANAWHPPGFLVTHLGAQRLTLAVRLGCLDEIPSLVGLLTPYRGFHATNSAGVLADAGPVELHLGIAAKALEDWDDAIADLTSAHDHARAIGARGFAVHAAVELAEALQQREAVGDAESALDLLRSAHSAAVALHMRPWIARIDELATQRSATEAQVLSKREAEVAGLVAEGLTNRQIAARLYLSERTAQNHVQHILTKLGFTTRSQIAAWHVQQS